VGIRNCERAAATESAASILSAKSSVFSKNIAANLPMKIGKIALCGIYSQ
jgi:hypothetical protein